MPAIEGIVGIAGRDGIDGIAGIDGSGTAGNIDPVTDGIARGGRFLATATSTVALRA